MERIVLQCRPYGAPQGNDSSWVSWASSQIGKEKVRDHFVPHFEESYFEAACPRLLLVYGIQVFVYKEISSILFPLSRRWWATNILGNLPRKSVQEVFLNTHQEYLSIRTILGEAPVFWSHCTVLLLQNCVMLFNHVKAQMCLLPRKLHPNPRSSTFTTRFLSPAEYISQSLWTSCVLNHYWSKPEMTSHI